MIIKWTYASVRKFFDTLSVPKIYTGEDEVPTDVSEYVEIAILGPSLTLLGDEQTGVWLEVRITINVNASNKNVFRVHEIADELTAFMTDITVMALGNTPEDDQSDKFCLSISKNVDYAYVGKVKDKNINRAVMAARWSQTIPF